MTNLMHKFLIHYNILLHVHVSSNILLILRGSNGINTPSGIVTVNKWPFGAQVEKEIRSFSTRSMWVRRRPFLLWWMQGHSYSLLWAECGWKSIAEVLSMIRERISAWYNLRILNHHVSTCLCVIVLYVYTCKAPCMMDT